MREKSFEGYLALTGTRQEDSGQDYIMTNLLNCTPQQILFGWSNKEECDGWGCTGDRRRAYRQGFGGETWIEETTLKTSAYMGRQHYNGSSRSGIGGHGMDWSGSR